MKKENRFSKMSNEELHECVLNAEDGAALEMAARFEEAIDQLAKPQRYFKHGVGPEMERNESGDMIAGEEVKPKKKRS